MAIRIAFVRVAQIAMGIDLDHAHIRMAFGVRANRPERAGMLRRQHELLTAWKAQGWKELDPEPVPVQSR